jgi:hypothetical protein
MIECGQDRVDGYWNRHGSLRSATCRVGLRRSSRACHATATSAAPRAPRTVVAAPGSALLRRRDRAGLRFARRRSSSEGLGFRRARRLAAEPSRLDARRIEAAKPVSDELLTGSHRPPIGQRSGRRIRSRVADGLRAGTGFVSVDGRRPHLRAVLPVCPCRTNPHGQRSDQERIRARPRPRPSSDAARRNPSHGYLVASWGARLMCAAKRPAKARQAAARKALRYPSA